MKSFHPLIVSALLFFGNGISGVVGDPNGGFGREVKIEFSDLQHSTLCNSYLFVNAYGLNRFEFKSSLKPANLSESCIILNRRLLLMSKQYKIASNLDTDDSLWLQNAKQLWNAKNKQPQSNSYYALPYILFFLPTIVFCFAGILTCVYLRYHRPGT